jgi:hypothetical protein
MPHAGSRHAVRVEARNRNRLADRRPRTARCRRPTISPAGAGAETSAPNAAKLTGKERLGEKWKDEQRIDNCKVPPDKRGTKPRRDGCAQAPVR